MKEAEKLYGDILLINAMAEQMKSSGVSNIDIEMDGTYSTQIIDDVSEKLKANDIEFEIEEEGFIFITMENCTITIYCT